MEFKHIFLIIAILAISVVAVPAVYSLFIGQHTFYDTGTSVCLKCHADIKQEMGSTIHHISFSCENCHNQESASNLTHASTVNPRCLDCHGTPPGMVADSRGNIFISPVASIFGENVTNEESHNPFVEAANSTPFMKGENEACIACHSKKSLAITMLYADTYKFSANRIIDSTWQLQNYSRNTETKSSFVIQANESGGLHSIPVISSLNCEKCHPEIRGELNSSLHHTLFSCSSCHQIYSSYHASSSPPCLACHGSPPRIVTDEKGNMFVSPIVSVYSNNPTGADAHIPFVSSTENSNISAGNNIACSSCHSSFNNNIRFSRPEFIEWDVVNTSGTWSIQNLVYGQTKEITITKNQDGKMHNISPVTEVNCISCHKDINQAVISGGHSNEQWKGKHNYMSYNDMNSYCRSCHKPVTQDNMGTSPYPEYPFNSNNHGAISITCMDCHGKSGVISVNIDGFMQVPAYNSSSMGGIESSISQQPVFVRSYLCIACKNTGNPVPDNSLHFKLYTEPQVTIYVNGTQRYP